MIDESRGAEEEQEGIADDASRRATIQRRRRSAGAEKITEPVGSGKSGGRGSAIVRYREVVAMGSALCKLMLAERSECDNVQDSPMQRQL